MTKARRLLLTAIALLVVGLVLLGIGDLEHNRPSEIVGVVFAAAGIGVGVWWLAVTPTEVDPAQGDRRGPDS
jgi:hypothetical protein